MAIISATTGKNNAIVIKTEVANKANTANRIGSNLEDIWDSLTHKDTTDSLNTSIDSKEPKSQSTNLVDISGVINMPNPLPKTYYVLVDGVDNDFSLQFPSVSEAGTYIQFFVRNCNGYNMTLKGFQSFLVNDSFPFDITDIDVGEFSFDLPSSPNDYAIFSLIYQDAWFVNASVYKLLVV